jgi:hypothetical protein
MSARLCDNNKVHRSCKTLIIVPEILPEKPLNTVSHRGVAYLFGNHKTQPTKLPIANSNYQAKMRCVGRFPPLKNPIILALSTDAQ